MGLKDCPVCGTKGLPDSLFNCPRCGFIFQEQNDKLKGYNAGISVKDRGNQIIQAKRKRLQTELQGKLRQINYVKKPKKPSFLLMIKEEITSIWFWVIMLFISMIPFGILVFFTPSTGIAFLIAISITLLIFLLITFNRYDKQAIEYKLATTDFPKYIEYLKQQVTEEYKTKFDNLEKYGDEYGKPNQNISSDANKTKYVPKCPICQSPNIKKLTVTKRAVHGAAFGLFSKTARSQWECNDCGNKW